ncbi:MAG: IS1595 family transposase, partial [Candidatus Saccharimonadales bacterium]
MESFNLIQFYQKFGTEEQCQHFLFKNRWVDGVTCPKCGEINVKTYKLASGRIKCASCRNTFTVRTRSVFEDSPVPLQKWFLAIYLCVSYKKGISSIQLSKFIGVTQKTAWFMLQRIRYFFENDSFELFTGEVEMDEAYIGGADKNKHHSKKLKTITGKGAQGFGSKNSKTPVVGMVERGGKLHAIAIKDTGSNTLMTLARTNIDIDATIYTDKRMPYRTLLKLGFKHASVNHCVKEFVNGMASTNT